MTTPGRKVSSYVARRLGTTVVVSVIFDDGFSMPLRHLVYHSPTGFEFGYGGSGPADLARSICGHFTENSRPDPRFYQTVKDRLLAGAGGESVVITVDQLNAIMREIGHGS